jgi:hypothetical protein
MEDNSQKMKTLMIRYLEEMFTIETPSSRHPENFWFKYQDKLICPIESGEDFKELLEETFPDCSELELAITEWMSYYRLKTDEEFFLPAREYTLEEYLRLKPTGKAVIVKNKKQ